MVTAREGAPGELELVRAFVNTVDLESGEDELASPAALAAWLAGRGLLPARAGATAAGREQAIAVRESLRALLLVNAGGEPAPAAAAVLDEAAARARLTVRFAPDGRARLEPAARGIAAALGRLLAVVAAAEAEGTWRRLKVCRSETCRWAFYDRARNRSGAWCSMAVCGNRAKARAYRRRVSR